MPTGVLYKVVSRHYPTRAGRTRSSAPVTIKEHAFTFMPSTSSPTTHSLALAQRAAQIALDTRANDVVLLDLRGVTDMTDFFLIASGTSDTHARSIGQHIMEELKKEGSPVHHVEGLEKGRWVLLDFVDFVVHIFHPTLRNFYQLERLWADAVEVPLDGGQGAGA
jgi:ribosome-associated protein